jgi:LCP family protein required for cell wall assembly
MTGANTGSVSGQRSDVMKIMHVDPEAGTITTLSIPRDTIVSLIANQAQFGNYNRLNVNFGNGPSLVAQTITADFGIPINHTIVVSFGGLINAADAVGGVWMDFPYPARDTMSSLNIPHAGCQLVTNLRALALVRSRHYEWYEWGKWNNDVTSDYGRIYRQDEFIKAFMQKAKHLYNPLTINSLLSKLPAGISLDDTFTLNDLLGLAVKFHAMNPSNMIYDTLPTAPAVRPGMGDVLYVQEPAAQEMLTKIFGTELERPTNPPPNQTGVAVMPPVIKVTTTPTASAHHHTKVTTTTKPAAQPTPEGDQWFDPYPCNP